MTPQHEPSDCSEGPGAVVVSHGNGCCRQQTMSPPPRHPVSQGQQWGRPTGGNNPSTVCQAVCRLPTPVTGRHAALSDACQAPGCWYQSASFFRGSVCTVCSLRHGVVSPLPRVYFRLVIGHELRAAFNVGQILDGVLVMARGCLPTSPSLFYTRERPRVSLFSFCLSSPFPCPSTKPHAHRTYS